MSHNTTFQFENVKPRLVASREIGASGQEQVAGLHSVEVTCACGHQWTATEGAGLSPALGGVIITCPVCGASEAERLGVLLSA